MMESNKIELCRAYGELRSRVIQLINEADPIRLLQSGAPRDEYEPEVGTILPRLKEATSGEDVTQIVHQEFERWFGPEEAGPLRRYAELGRRIWRSYQKRPSHN